MEALKVIASAWAVAFIILFGLWTLTLPTVKPDHRILIWFAIWLVLLSGAVTGAGWLYYRSTSKT